MADTNSATSASSFSAPATVRVSLSNQEPPLPDGMYTIRCCCRRGCRRRCPVGRREPCLACLSPVGPCCGISARYLPQGPRGSPLDFVVCHACLRPMDPAGCRWSGPPSVFSTMSFAESLCWQALRAELVWQDLLAELANGEAQTRP